MARYKHYDYRQTRMLPVSFDRQILPGMFEYTLNYLIDEKIDLSVFEARYQNDESGALAYDLGILLKIIFCVCQGSSPNPFQQIAAKDAAPAEWCRRARTPEYL